MAVKFRHQALDHAARRLDGDVIMFAPPTVRLSVVVALLSLCAVGVAAANIKVPDSYSVVATMVADRGVNPVIAKHPGSISAIHFVPGQYAGPGATLALIDLAHGTGSASKDTIAVQGGSAGLMCCRSAHVGMRVDSGDLLFGVVPGNTEVSILVEVPESLAKMILANPSVTVRSNAAPGMKSNLSGLVTQVPSASSRRSPDGLTILRIEFDAADQPALRRDFAASEGSSVPVVLELPARTLLDKFAAGHSRRAGEAAGKGA